MVEDWDTGVPGEDEVAVHGMDGEVGGDGALGGGETLGYDGAAVDAAGSRGVPEWAGVGVQILPDSSTILLRRHVKGMGGERKGSLTGAIAPNSVSSSTSSIADWFGFGGGGLMRVAREVSSFSSFDGSGAPSRALNMLLIFSSVVSDS